MALTDQGQDGGQGRRGKPKTSTLLIVGAVAVVGGYLYLRHKASQAQPSSGGGGRAKWAADGAPLSAASWQSFVHDQHGPPKHRPRHHKK